jgi:hypothetical protein
MQQHRRQAAAAAPLMRSASTVQMTYKEICFLSLNRTIIHGKCKNKGKKKSDGLS